MMQDFLQQNGHIPTGYAQDFAVEQMRRDLDGYRISAPRPHKPSWAAEFGPGEQERMEAAFQVPKTGGYVPANLTPSEFQKFEQAQRGGASIATSGHHTPLANQIGDFQRPMRMGYGMNIGMMGSQYTPAAMQQPQSQQVNTGKGKERMVELHERDWEQQFAAMDTAEQQDVDAEANAAMEAELEQMDRSVFSEPNEFDEFESIWRGIQAEGAATRQLNVDEMRMHMGDDIAFRDFDTWDGFDSNFHDGYRDPQLGNYIFEQDNPFNTTRNPFDEGLEIMREGGNLSLAALAFEAAVQQDPQHFEAWSQLGNTQAQNEKETPAIRALEQALKLDPTNLPALMGLAISYTNEGYDTTAYRTLERWLATKYPQVISPSELSADTDLGFTDRHLLHEQITALFIRAAQLSPDGEHMDPDVQVGLGVLFYGAEEYAKAVDCFESALASTEAGSSNEPQQAHLLWNRLGATLANSGRSEEAIDAYEKALTLNPNFVRARYNLGVSCINIGVFEQAAQHLLGALSMHNVVKREGMDRIKEVMGNEPATGRLDESDVEGLASMNQSTNLFQTLRRVFGSMGRKDLAEKVEVGMDIEQFRGEFDF